MDMPERGRGGPGRPGLARIGQAWGTACVALADAVAVFPIRGTLPVGAVGDLSIRMGQVGGFVFVCVGRSLIRMGGSVVVFTSVRTGFRLSVVGPMVKASQLRQGACASGQQEADRQQEGAEAPQESANHGPYGECRPDQARGQGHAGNSTGQKASEAHRAVERDKVRDTR